jgi:hypothetical protein
MCQDSFTVSQTKKNPQPNDKYICIKCENILSKEFPNQIKYTNQTKPPTEVGIVSMRAPMRDIYNLAWQPIALFKPTTGRKLTDPEVEPQFLDNKVIFEKMSNIPEKKTAKETYTRFMTILNEEALKENTENINDEAVDESLIWQINTPPAKPITPTQNTSTSKQTRSKNDLSNISQKDLLAQLDEAAKLNKQDSKKRKPEELENQSNKKRSPPIEHDSNEETETEIESNQESKKRKSEDLENQTKKQGEKQIPDASNGINDMDIQPEITAKMVGGKAQLSI